MEDADLDRILMRAKLVKDADRMAEELEAFNDEVDSELLERIRVELIDLGLDQWDRPQTAWQLVLKFNARPTAAVLRRIYSHLRKLLGYDAWLTPGAHDRFDRGVGSGGSGRVYSALLTTAKPFAKGTYRAAPIALDEMRAVWSVVTYFRQLVRDDVYRPDDPDESDFDPQYPHRFRPNLGGFFDDAKP